MLSRIYHFVYLPLVPVITGARTYIGVRNEIKRQRGPSEANNTANVQHTARKQEFPIMSIITDR